jgi:transcriptional regulator with XRE-family HTH domain
MSVDPHDAIIGKNIRLHRVAKRMSQEELGKYLGVTFQQIQKYEKGTNRVSASRLLTVATVLEVPLLTLYGTLKGTSKGSAPLELLHRKDAYRLAEAFDKITSQRTRNSIVSFVQTVAEAK